MPESLDLELPRSALGDLVARQLQNLFVLDSEERPALEAAIDVALERCAHGFARTPNKYYRREGRIYLNPFHSGQNSIFLYHVSHALSTNPAVTGTLADRVYYLNKVLNGLDLYHEVVMPRVFMLDHPVGSVLGRATYGERFTFSQNCTVGNNHGFYPVIGCDVTLCSGAKLLGNCRIGDRVVLAANAFVKDTDVPSDSLVFGSSPHLVVKPLDPRFASKLAGVDVSQQAPDDRPTRTDPEVPTEGA